MDGSPCRRPLNARAPIPNPQSPPQPMSASQTDVLAELVRSKLACLEQLRELGQRQYDLIERDDMTALMDVLTRKQRTLMKLQQIERGLNPFRDEDPEERRWSTPQQRRICSGQLDQCEALLDEIVREEKRSERELVHRRDQVAEQLQGAHLACRVHGAYTAESSHGVSQLDVLSET